MAKNKNFIFIRFLPMKIRKALFVEIDMANK